MRISGSSSTTRMVGIRSFGFGNLAFAAAIAAILLAPNPRERADCELVPIRSRVPACTALQRTSAFHPKRTADNRDLLAPKFSLRRVGYTRVYCPRRCPNNWVRIEPDQHHQTERDQEPPADQSENDKLRN